MHIHMNGMNKQQTGTTLIIIIIIIIYCLLGCCCQPKSPTIVGANENISTVCRIVCDKQLIYNFCYFSRVHSFICDSPCAVASPALYRQCTACKIIAWNLFRLFETTNDHYRCSNDNFWPVLFFQSSAFAWTNHQSTINTLLFGHFDRSKCIN